MTCREKSSTPEACVPMGDTGEVAPLVEGEDYYLDHGLMVLTARYHLRRGYCCEQGCRHCPFGDLPGNTNAKRDETSS